MSEKTENLPSNPESGQETTPTESKSVVARKTAQKAKPAKPKTKGRAKKRAREDSHEGRPKNPITYVIEGLKNHRFRGPQLQWAIEKVEAYEREKAAKKSGAKAVRHDRVPTPWEGIDQRSHFTKAERVAPAPKQTDADIEGNPREPAQREAKTAAEKQAEAIQGSAFADEAAMRLYRAARRDNESMGISSLDCIAFEKPSGALVYVDNTPYCTDSYVIQNSRKIRVKAEPQPNMVLADRGGMLQWMDKLSLPKPAPAKPIVQGLDLWAGLPMPERQPDRHLHPGIIPGGLTIDGRLVLPRKM
jgi:hypothetical protein